MKYSNDTIGIRTRDIPACSALPQPTVPRKTVWESKLMNVRCWMLWWFGFESLLVDQHNWLMLPDLHFIFQFVCSFHGVLFN